MVVRAKRTLDGPQCSSVARLELGQGHVGECQGAEEEALAFLLAHEVDRFGVHRDRRPRRALTVLSSGWPNFGHPLLKTTGAASWSADDLDARGNRRPLLVTDAGKETP